MVGPCEVYMLHKPLHAACNGYSLVHTCLEHS
jgi:hypothetical protein